MLDNVMLFVRQDFNLEDSKHYQAEIVPVNLGNNFSNKIVIDGSTESQIKQTEAIFLKKFQGLDVILTHDLLYQPNFFIGNIAAKRIAQKLNVKFLHWIHSSTNLAKQAGQFNRELKAKFPNSKLVCFHAEEIECKRKQYGFERDEVVILPSPIDFTEDYSQTAKHIIDKADLWSQDIVIVYPCRLDRGKQPHIVIEIADHLNQLGYKTKAVIVDFHSTGGDKVKYRNEMKSDNVFFVSDLYPYSISHKAVMELMEFSDVFIHPSRSEADGLILFEAAWKRCGLVLNFDLPRFREFEQYSRQYKFSSNIDLLNGETGNTETNYKNRNQYFEDIAKSIIYDLEHNPVLAMRRKVKKERSLVNCKRQLEIAIAGLC